MLMLLLVFVQGKETTILNPVLSSVFSPGVEAPQERSQIWLAPRSQAGIRHFHLRDVSSPHLVKGWSLIY